MNYQEEMLQAFEHCSICDDNPDCPECPLIGQPNCDEILKERIRLYLKTQIPRLMTLEEVIASESNVWLEFEAEEGGYYRYGFAFFSYTDNNVVELIVRDGYRPLCAFIANEYGKIWRCWTSKPNDDQRKATKWE